MLLADRPVIVHWSVEFLPTLLGTIVSAAVFNPTPVVLEATFSGQCNGDQIGSKLSLA